jgi:hypothetical protein
VGQFWTPEGHNGGHEGAGVPALALSCSSPSNWVKKLLTLSSVNFNFFSLPILIPPILICYVGKPDWKPGWPFITLLRNSYFSIITLFVT